MNGLRLLAPTALALAALAVPILLLYMLKLRRREVQVSSTLLWNMLLRDRQANTPWQRLKRNLLLLLQLLVLAGLVFALARPALPVPSITSGSAVIVLDASASMNAQDTPTGESRFQQALRLTTDLLDRLPGDAQVTLIRAGGQPQVLASGETDPATLRRALEGLSADLQPAEWAAAFALAAGAASSHEDADIVLISDGGIPEEGLPPLPVPLRYLQVGTSSDNLSLSALALRPSANGAELFARVTNHGDSARQAILSISMDGQLLEARELDIPAGESSSLSFGGLPNTLQSYEARLSAPAGAAEALDDFPLDDVAFAVYQPPSSGRTLLVTEGNFFLEQLLAALPGVEPFRALPGEDGSLALPPEPYNVTIFDSLAPADWPEGNLLLINPPSSALLPVSGVISATGEATVANHPLTQYLDWANVHVRQARAVETPPWATALVSTEGGPLVLAGETGGRRVAVVTFALRDSDLPLQVAFPVLFANLLDYLIQAGPLEEVQATGLRTGQSLTLPAVAGATQVEVLGPNRDNRILSLQAGPALFTDTGTPGIFGVRWPGSVVPEQRFAVNLFAPGESDIRPRANVLVGQSAVSAAAQQQTGQRELWPWLAALALALLVAEWWLYHRRSALPRPV